MTRRRALAESAGGALGLALALTGCGAGGSGRSAAASGSTRESTWSDPIGNGQLRVTAGEPLLARTELGQRSAMTETLATFAHITDSHALDASSPARVTFLDRLGPPFQSTFRPQEALTVQVLAGIGPSVRALSPGFVIQGGDLIDNAQANELTHALAALRGGRVSPGSGPHGYDGVQSASDTDPFYYRPALDAPRHPQLLRDAVRPFTAAGVGRVPIHPVLGDHDALVAGELVPTALTRSLALGDRALWNLPTGLTLPPGLRTEAVNSPDGPPNPGMVDVFLRRALAGPTVRVGADPTRSELSFDEVLTRMRAAAAATFPPAPRSGRLDYVLDVGARLRLIVLDLVRRGGGSGGEVVPGQSAWLQRQLDAAEDRWVLVVSHQPIASSLGGEALLAAMDAAPHVVAALSGHTHRNAIVPRQTDAGGYWLISTASLIDYPQQARALAVHTTADGGVAIATWMLDHVDGGGLGTIARELSYLDAQGGRPQSFAGEREDRNVILYRTCPAAPPS